MERAMGEVAAALCEAPACANVVSGEQTWTHGASVNAPDKDGVTPLHRAAESGDVELVKLLVALGADVNAATTAGWTPLHGAAAAGCARVVRLLLAAGADASAVNRWGETPLDCAIRWCRPHVAVLL